MSFELSPSKIPLRLVSVEGEKIAIFGNQPLLIYRVMFFAKLLVADCISCNRMRIDDRKIRFYCISYSGILHFRRKMAYMQNSIVPNTADSISQPLPQHSIVQNTVTAVPASAACPHGYKSFPRPFFSGSPFLSSCSKPNIHYETIPTVTLLNYVIIFRKYVLCGWLQGAGFQ